MVSAQGAVRIKVEFQRTEKPAAKTQKEPPAKKRKTIRIQSSSDEDDVVILD